MEPGQFQIFRGRYIAGGNACRFIIDNGCEQNLVSLKTIESLGLEMDWYPVPDQIKWLNSGGEITCMGVCKTPLSIGKCYSETIFVMLC